MRWFRPGENPEFFERPAILLSASVPYERPAAVLTPEEKQANARYVKTARPERIRIAVIELCRFAFDRDWNLVFGGHPAISPLVLRAAHQFVLSENYRKRVVVFHSGFFLQKGVIPDETRALGDWEHGTILWTEPREPKRGTDKRRRRDASLTWMREAMVASPNLIAAVFLGGMEGVIEEAELFRKRPGARMFALGSTGSAAADLLSEGTAYAGFADVKLLRNSLAYPQVFQTCLGGLDRSTRSP